MADQESSASGESNGKSGVAGDETTAGPTMDGALERELAGARGDGTDIDRAQLRARLSTELFGKPAEPVRLGRFVLLERLGQGAMGVVYDAYDPQLDRKVALKLLGRKHIRCGRARLLREARALARLSHPNVVQVYDADLYQRPGGAGEAEPNVFVAMEYVEGHTLEQWQRATPRPSWREVLRVYLDVCRGLAAAHQAGIVHRDIKPSNLMIGRDKRVRVVDFGLAAGREREPAGESAEVVGFSEDDATLSLGEIAIADTPGPFDETAMTDTPGLLEGRLDDRLTRSNAVMGTPMYMSPEQPRGGSVGPAADQYGTCVSMYQALYGVLPFSWPEGQGSAEAMCLLLQEKMQHRIADPPAESVVPEWLARVLHRGLSPEPKERYGSMEALIAALEDDPDARRRALRRRVGIVIAAVVLAGLAFLGWTRRPAAVAPCAGIGARMAGVWDGDTRSRVRQAFVATGAAYAPDTVERVTRRLDEYAATWLDMREAQCRAPGDELATERALCMSRRRDRLVALAEVLGGGLQAQGALSTNREVDAEVVANAAQAVSSLPPLTDCTDDDYLSARISPPDDPALRQRIEALQPRVARLSALYSAGKYSDGAAEGVALLAELEEIDYPPLVAEALYWTAAMKDAAGDYAGAEALADKSIRAAARGKDDILTAKGWSLLLRIVGVNQRRLEDAKPLVTWVDMLASRADDEETWAMALNESGLVRHAQGDYAGALEHYRRALARQEKAVGPDHPGVANIVNNIGRALRNQGDYAGALEHYRRALAIDEKTLGPEHPHGAVRLNNIGVVLARQGDYPGALEHYRRALAIDEKSLGPDHPDVAVRVNNIGVVLVRQGDYAGALKHFRRALAIDDKALGPRHPIVAIRAHSIGNALKHQGDYAGAMSYFQRSLAIDEKARGPEHTKVAIRLNSIGDVLYYRGDYAGAMKRYRRGLAIEENALGPEHPDIAYSLTDMGRVLIAQGSLDAARRHLERAREIREQALGSEHPTLARVWLFLGELALRRGRPGRALELFERARELDNAEIAPGLMLALAKALWGRNQPGDRARAIAAATSARDVFAARPNEPERAKVEAWLASHRLP